MNLFLIDIGDNTKVMVTTVVENTTNLLSKMTLPLFVFVQ